MADHEALQAQSAEAFAKASAFFNVVDGWTVIDTTDGFTTSLHPTDNVPVLRVEGESSKPPGFFRDFMLNNGASIREKHFRFHVARELVESFEDQSIVTKETLNIPTVGEVQQYRYYQWSTSEDGTVNSVGTQANLEKYPGAAINLVFSVINLTPTEGGSHVRFFMQSVSSVEMDQAARLASANIIKDFYIGIAKEANAA